MRNFVLILILSSILTSLVAAHAQAVIGGIDVQKNINLAGQVPRNIMKVSEVLISRPEYVISYNRQHREMNWASWLITPSSMGHSGRSGNFAADQELEKYLATFSEHAVTPNDYKGSCFDRGHQVPSGDRTSSPQVNGQVFFMSNMIPQTAYLNKGAWEGLESYIREKVKKESKRAYVIAGPLFDENFGTIGKNNDILVPSKNFKIVIFLNANQTVADINENTENIAVIMPNILSSGKTPLDDKKELCDEASQQPSEKPDWRKFKTTISEVERVSGFQFFSF